MEIYIKIQVIALIINFRRNNPFAIERCKSKMVASVSVALAFFNCSSGDWINLIDYTFKIRVVNV